MKHCCSVHPVCAAAQWQLKYPLKYGFKFGLGTTKAAAIPSKLRSCSTQQAQASSAASKYEVSCLYCQQEASEGAPMQTIENATF